MANHYDVPNWAGKPPVGLHLDVLKGDRLVQKLMIDQKKCYLFGRNKEMCDFAVDHQSCSRVHAAFVYHKSLQKSFLVDLGSTHGTFIGNIQIESHKPTQLPIDSQFHFGHSTRVYTLRARPQSPKRQIIEELEEEYHDDLMNESSSSVSGVVVVDTSIENELVMDNITEYNTAHNRRIPLIGITDKTESFGGPSSNSDGKTSTKRRSVTFNDEDEVINPEDIDPTIGRFRNLVHSTTIPSKRFKGYENFYGNSYDDRNHKINKSKFVNIQSNRYSDLYYDVPALHPNHQQQQSSQHHHHHHQQQQHSDHEENNNEDDDGLQQRSVAEQLGLPLPNPAPDVDTLVSCKQIAASASTTLLPLRQKSESETPKKKYAKEAWPGKKPVLSTA